jgi:hypothetical protein
MVTRYNDRLGATDALLDDNEAGCVAVLKTYLDESASSTDRVLTVAGILLDTPHSRKLNHFWKDTLKEYDLDHFHMTDCANGAPPYDAIGRPRCDKLARRLIQAIRRHVEFQVAVSLNISEYVECARTVSLESNIDLLHGFGGPYSFLVQLCMHAVADYSDAKSSKEPISYYLEQGNECQGETNDILGRICLTPGLVDRLRYYRHAFVPKLGMRLLQAADIVAYEWMRDRCEQMERERIRPRRLSLAYLIKNLLVRVEHLRREDLLHRQRESLEFNIKVIKTNLWRRYNPDTFSELGDLVLAGKPLRGRVMMKT